MKLSNAEMQEIDTILEKYCKDNNLFMSGGSDCHGTKKAEAVCGRER